MQAVIFSTNSSTNPCQPGLPVGSSAVPGVPASGLSVLLSCMVSTSFLWAETASPSAVSLSFVLGGEHLLIYLTAAKNLSKNAHMNLQRNQEINQINGSLLQQCRSKDMNFNIFRGLNAIFSFWYLSITKLWAKQGTRECNYSERKSKMTQGFNCPSWAKWKKK